MTIRKKGHIIVIKLTLQSDIVILNTESIGSFVVSDLADLRF